MTREILDFFLSKMIEILDDHGLYFKREAIFHSFFLPQTLLSLIFPHQHPQNGCVPFVRRNMVKGTHPLPSKNFTLKNSKYSSGLLPIILTSCSFQSI